MANKLDLPDIGSLAVLSSARSKINSNFNKVESAINNTLSRDGTAPNQMEAELDLNDHKVINVADPVADMDAVNKRSIKPLVDTYAAQIAQLIVEGTARVDRFIATSGQTVFTLTDPPGTSKSTIVTDNGIMLIPDLDYTVLGSTLTFNTGRHVGNEIVVRYTQLSPTDSLLRADLLNTNSAKGAALVTYTNTGTGAIARSLMAKGQDVVHANDWGLVGDGVTDETTKLQQLFNAAQGKILMLGNNKTYAIATATGLSIPSNTTLIANGSKIARLTARAGALTDAEFNITVGDDCHLDKLEVVAVGGSSDIGGVLISGNRVRIDTLKVTTATSGSGSLGSLWNAVRIGPNSGSSSNVTIGTLVCSNWDRPVTIQNLTQVSVGHVDITNYARGVYIKDCVHATIHGGYIRTKSANATGTAGENGVLIEATVSNGSTRSVRVENVTVEDSGEHGYRIGGAYTVKGIWHVDCKAKNTGAGNTGTYPPNNNGGCGFKCLGPTATSGARHHDIHYVGCSVWDINATSINNVFARGGNSNFAGFQIGKVFGASIVNPIVAVTPADGSYAETGASCYNGIEIIGSQKVTISNPQIQRPFNSGIYIYDFSDGVNDWGQTDDIDIIGGHINSPGVAGLEVNCSVITMRRISVQGFMQVNTGQYSMKVTKSGTGAFTNCWASIRSISPTTESFNGLGTDWVISAQGNEVGSSACANGSTYQSATAGTLRVRKAGAWTSL